MQGSKPTIRRDDRAEPDDDEEAVGSSRVDVVSVEGARGDTATSGMVALRRELAKLNQQAAAVEKSLDDQRRERTDALERREKERQHTLALEARIASAEAETALVRKAHEGAIAELRAAHETSLAELRQARDERAAFEATATVAKAAAASTAKEEAAAKAAKEEAAAKTAKEEATKHAAAVTKLNEELARAKADHARDRTTARERIDVLERSVEEASAATQRMQADLDSARQNEVRLSGEVQAAKQNAELLVAQYEAARQTEESLLDEIEAARQREERVSRQLEAALARAVEAESQALNISLQHASLEGSLRTLRDEVTSAFARVGSLAAAAAAVSSSRMLPITPDLNAAFASPTASSGDELRASAPPSGMKTLEPPVPHELPGDAKRSTPPPPSYGPNSSPTVEPTPASD